MFRFLVFFFYTLTLSRAEFPKKHDYEDRRNTFTYLIPSSTKLPYYKIDIPGGGVEVVYDCTVGNSMQGTVLAVDNTHPTNMRFLTIKNCEYIKVDFPCHLSTEDYTKIVPHFRSSGALESIKIENVEDLMLQGPSSCQSNCVRSNFTIRLHISNIRNINIKFYDRSNYYNSFITDRVYDCFKYQIKTLELENVQLSTLDREVIPLNITRLYLKEVKIENLNENFSVRYGENSALRITDSYFGSIGTGSFVFDVERVQIQRNHFKRLEHRAFSGVARNSFIISDNHLEKTDTPFEVRTPNVQFINNTVESYNTFFLRAFELYRAFTPITFNFSQNSIGFVPEFILKISAFPDFLQMKNNRFNCSCGSFGRYIETESSHERIFKLVLKAKENNNVCANYGNCAVSKFLSRISDACLGNFECPENDVQIEDEETFVKNSVKSVLNYLKEISEKLSILGNMINSTISEKRTMWLTPDNQ